MKILKLFWVFIIGCIIGYIMEVTLNILLTGEFVTKQGLIYGPLAPVYGLGTLAFYLVLPNLKGKINIFLVGAILGGVTEYLCSYFQEKWFGTISWDYTNLFMNLHGRTSLMYCIIWGILALVFIKWVYPFIEKIMNNFLLKISAKVITSITIIFMIFNISISSFAAVRQYERRNKIVADSKLDKFLDKYYPDEFMNKVYTNKIEK